MNTQCALPIMPTPSLRGHSTRILMSLDAVGGVWRYAMDLARGLEPMGYEWLFVGFGPEPDAIKRREAEQLGELVWTGLPLDWMVDDPSELASGPATIAELATRYDVDLVHLNLPSQARSLCLDVPLIVVSHSCVVTWFSAVRGTAVPENWQWQHQFNRAGFDAADAVLAPSRSHARALLNCYGRIDGLRAVHNATNAGAGESVKENFVFAASRWWDDGKNGAVLDHAAALLDTPVVMAGPQRGPNGQYLPIEHAEARGELSHKDTASLMGRAAIVCSPSIYEPFGLAALEGARAGAALVLADIPTYRELWDGVALFADPHDPEAFAAAIRHLSDYPDMRELYGLRAARRAAEYTLAAQAEAMSGIYLNALENGRAQRARPN